MPSGSVKKKKKKKETKPNQTKTKVLRHEIVNSMSQMKKDEGKKAHPPRENIYLFNCLWKSLPDNKIQQVFS